MGVNYLCTFFAPTFNTIICLNETIFFNIKGSGFRINKFSFG